MSRYTLTKNPVQDAVNGGCAWSGVSVDGHMTFVDLDYDLGLDAPLGPLYAAETVVSEWARLIGYVSPVEHNKLQAELAAAESELSLLRAYKADTERVLDGLNKLGVAVTTTSKKVSASA